MPPTDSTTVPTSIHRWLAKSVWRLGCIVPGVWPSQLFHFYCRATSVSSHNPVTMLRQAKVPSPLLDVTRPLIRRANSPAHLRVANTPSNFAGGLPGRILQSRYRCYFFVRVMLSNTCANQDNNFHQTYGWGRQHVLHPWHFSSSYGDSCLAKNLWRLTSRWLLFFLSFSRLFIYQQPIFNAIRRLGYFGGFRQKAADTLNYNIVVQTTENKRKKKQSRLRNLNIRKQRGTVS